MEFLMIVITLAISVWNAYVSGKQWPLAKLVGGFPKLVAISGAVMSAIGFTMVYAMAIMWGYLVVHGPNPHVMAAFSALFPAFIILPLVMAAVIITISSWKAVFTSGQSGTQRVVNVLAASWNTYATISDVVAVPGIMQKAFSFMNSDDDSDSTGVVTGIILLALMGGVVTAWAIFRKAAASAAFELQAYRQ